MLKLDRTTLLRPLLAVPAAMLWLAAPAWGASFTALGDIAGGVDFYSKAFGLSGDGLVAVGETHSPNGTEAFRWVGGTMTGLGDLPLGVFSSTAAATNGDGSVVAGTGNSAGGSEAFRWDTSGGGTMVGLGSLNGGQSSASGISSDGTAISGTSTSALGIQAFRWQGGMTGLGSLGGTTFHSTAAAISGNGLAVVGESISANGTEAFLWTVGSGVMTGLGDLAGGGFESQALGVNSDGTLVVGFGSTGFGQEAFLWQSGVGMSSLGDLAGGTTSAQAYDVNDAGIAVGSGQSGTGKEAFIHDGTTMYSLTNVLIANGLGAALAGWTLTEARAISADGLTIAGWGVNPSGDTEGWIATYSVVPEPHSALLLALGLTWMAARRRRAP